MSEKVWYYSVAGQRQGPVTAEELRQNVAEGGIGPDDLVWKKGMAEWVATRTIKGLIAKPTAPTPKAGPPPLPPRAVPAARIAPPPLDDAGGGDSPFRTKVAGHLQPVIATWQKMPTPGKIGIAGATLFTLLLGCGGVLFMAIRLIGSGGDTSLAVTAVIREYDTDSVAAGKKYKGKAMVFTGVVSIPYRPGATADVHLEHPKDLKNPSLFMICSFGAKDETALTNYKRGDAIRFRGVCQGVQHDQILTFANCELVSEGYRSVSVSGRSSGGTRYAEKAQQVTGTTGRGLNGHPPGSKADFVQALGILGIGTGSMSNFETVAVEEYGKYVKAPLMRGGPLELTNEKWQAVFGEHEELSDLVVFIGNIRNETQRRSYRCSDGTLTLQGNTVPGGFVVRVVRDGP